MVGGNDNSSDAELFRRAMQESGVRPARLQQQRNPPDNNKTIAKPTTVKTNKAAPTLSARTLSARTTPPRPVLLDQTTEGPQVLFVREGVGKPTIRKLRSGLIRIDESIDLHGMRSIEAARALENFLEESIEHGYACIEIIHGKGQRSEQAGGILKPMAIHWLKQQPEVVAFCSAIASHGGSGATCVLLDLDN